MKYYQQGDVLFIPVSSVDVELKKKDNNVVAEGEATGHAHRVISDDADVMVDPDGNIYVQSKKDISVTHEEHGPVNLPADKYRIQIVREFDHLENAIRKVRD